MLRTLDRYEIGPLLGSGAMADVFEAYDPRLRRRVAVKILKVDGLDAAGRARFEREALAGAQLAHPNAAAIYDYAAEAHPPFLVMELVDGPTLAQHVERVGRLDPTEAVSIAAQVLGALEAAHNLGIVHRDVKPSNVILAGDGTAKLVDFGIAKSMEPRLGEAADMTATGLVVGTPKYLAPEQLYGAPATPRSDLYAAGLVLYELLAGVAAFAPATTPVAHHRTSIPDLRAVRPGLPPALYATVDRSLADDPAERFTDAATMRAALAAGVEGESTVALDALDPTRTAVVPVVPMLAGSRPGHTRRARPGRWVVAAALVVAIVAGGILVAASGGDEDPSTDAVASEPSTIPSTIPPTTTTVSPPPTTAALQAASISDLLGLLAATPGAYGSAAEDLARDLERLLEHPDKHGRDVDRLRESIDAWVANGELDPRVGALVGVLLDQQTTFDVGPGSSGRKSKEG
jgi:eukaryotic-like serine/threonine-protein kinase